ncbi:MAG: cytochrome-c peroxidase [Opitutaceae bacterium]|nr:cytochrome-c peroxidase [Cytophagales bacterium]
MLNFKEFKTGKITMLLALVILLTSCKKSSRKEEITVSPATEKQSPFKVEYNSFFNPPSYFPPPVYDFTQNPLTAEKIELGKMLFYDPILSGDSTIACSNCHQPFGAFSNVAHSVSHGIRNQNGIRNIPGLFNLAWMPDYMLDGGIAHLDIQSIAPIENSVEMGSNLPNVLKALNKNKAYKRLFKITWNVEEIGSEHFLKSLTQFMLTIISSNSKYDMYKQGKVSLSANESEGLQLVQQKCSGCHGGELFTDFAIRNIGLDSTAGNTSDLGKENITGRKSDRRKFRTPSLRNFSLSYPYFHNSTAYSLSAVLERHDSLVNISPNLDPLLQTNGKTGIPVSPEEMSKIFAFLKTLNDNTISTNPAYTSPLYQYVSDH